MDIKELDNRIQDMQRLLSKDKLSEAERISLYNTLTFLLDYRAFINLKGLSEQTKEEKN